MRLGTVARVARIMALVLPLALLSAACDAGTGVDAENISVLLSSTPGVDIKKAVVTISEVYVAGDGEEVLLTEKSITLDLVGLSNDVAVLADYIAVPAGSYTELRLVLEGAYIEVANADGTTSLYTSSEYTEVPKGTEIAGTLDGPFGSNDGIVIDLEARGLRIGGKGEIVLADFDLSRSFVPPTGSADQWLMTPALRASDIEKLGAVRIEVQTAPGLVFPTLDGTPVTLAKLALRLVNEAGVERRLTLRNTGHPVVAEFHYLFHGVYAVDLVAPDGIRLSTDPGLPMPVAVDSELLISKEILIDEVTSELN